MNVTWLVIRTENDDLVIPSAIESEERAIGFIGGRNDEAWQKAWVGVPLDTRTVDGEVRVRPRGTSLPHVPIHPEG